MDPTIHFSCFVNDRLVKFSYVESVSSINKCVERTARRGSWRPLPYLTSDFIWMRKLIFTGKSRNWKSNLCGNHTNQPISDLFVSLSSRGKILAKRINVRVEHIKHSKCRDDFLR